MPQFDAVVTMGVALPESGYNTVTAIGSLVPDTPASGQPITAFYHVDHGDTTGAIHLVGGPGYAQNAFDTLSLDGGASTFVASADASFDSASGTWIWIGPGASPFFDGQVLDFNLNKSIEFVDSGTSLVDCRYAALVTQGISPAHINGMELLWLQANGATSPCLSDAWLEMLAANGHPNTTKTDGWFALLGSLGYTGHINDREEAFWCTGGGTLPPPVHGFNNDFNGDFPQ